MNQRVTCQQDADGQITQFIERVRADTVQDDRMNYTDFNMRNFAVADNQVQGTLNGGDKAQQK